MIAERQAPRPLIDRVLDFLERTDEYLRLLSRSLQEDAERTGCEGLWQEASKVSFMRDSKEILAAELARLIEQRDRELRAK